VDTGVTTAVAMNITVFRDVTQCSLAVINVLFYLVDEGSTLLRNDGS
jgi:hypothetical protein